MPTERYIREEAVKRLEHEGWIVWWPSKSRSFTSKDIFTVFDLCCQRPGYFVTRFIQLTDQTNHAARRKKVLHWLTTHDLMMWAEIWSWNPRAEAFRIEGLMGITAALKHGGILGDDTCA